jgi:hypothetical protein
MNRLELTQKKRESLKDLVQKGHSDKREIQEILTRRFGSPLSDGTFYKTLKELLGQRGGLRLVKRNPGRWSRIPKAGGVVETAVPKELAELIEQVIHAAQRVGVDVVNIDADKKKFNIHQKERDVEISLDDERPEE